MDRLEWICVIARDWIIRRTLWINVVCLFILLAIALWMAQDYKARSELAQRALVSCDERAQATLRSAVRCDAQLTSCIGSVSRIADELELSEAVLR